MNQEISKTATRRPPADGKTGAMCAFINAALAVLTLFVALFLIGPAVIADRSLFIGLALNNPAPIIIQDVLKFASAFASAVILRALYLRFRDFAPRLMKTATLFGLLSILFLLANGSLSLFSISRRSAGGSSEAGMRIIEIIGVLGLAVIFANGIWYLLVSWAALKNRLLPRPLGRLGAVIGALSLIPLLGIVVLALSVVWWAWLGASLLKNGMPEKQGAAGPA